MSEIWFMVNPKYEVSTIEVEAETKHTITRKSGVRANKRSNNWNNFFKTTAEVEKFLEERIKEREARQEKIHAEIFSIREQIWKIKRGKV